MTPRDFERADDLRCVLDHEGRFMRINPAFTTTLGWSFDELRCTAFIELVHVEDLVTLDARREELDGWIEAIEFTGRLRCKDGSHRWLAWTLWNDEQGGMCGSAENATETLQRELEHSLLFEISHDLLSVANTDGYFLRINRAFMDTLGWSQEELLSRPFLDFVHPDDVEATLEEIATLAQGKTTIAFENRYRTASGDHRWLHWTSTPISGVLYSVARDVTDHKAAQRELVEATEAAEAANRAKSEFLSSMSHELRTPLNAILGYSQIFLRDRELSAAHRERVETIRQSGEYLLVLISDILDLSKIEAGKLELVDTSFHLGEFLDTIIELFELRARQNRLSFIAHRDPGLPSAIRCDQTRLRQVLINLLSNAVKFTRQGGVTLRVEHGDGGLTFEIQDTGVGIPGDRLEAIFMPFEQAHGGEMAFVDGTGLGLPISRRLIEMMGGALEVASEVGHGSRFWFTITPPVAEEYRPGQVSHRVIDGYEGPRRTLLVVDDKRENRAVLRDLLGAVGFEILEAVDGEQAVAVTRDRRPDLVFMDLVMPRLDGFEAVRRIRCIPELDGIAIIAASASVFEHHQQESKTAGCDGFLPKPIAADAVFALLAEHLDLVWQYRGPSSSGRGLESSSTSGASPGEASGSGEAESARSPAGPGEEGLDSRSCAAIHEAAGIGDIRRILDILEQAGITAESVYAGDVRGLSQELYRLARRFQSNAIRELLEPLLEDTR